MKTTARHFESCNYSPAWLGRSWSTSKLHSSLSVTQLGCRVKIHEELLGWESAAILRWPEPKQAQSSNFESERGWLNDSQVENPPPLAHFFVSQSSEILLQGGAQKDPKNVMLTPPVLLRRAPLPPEVKPGVKTPQVPVHEKC